MTYCHRCSTELLEGQISALSAGAPVKVIARLPEKKYEKGEKGKKKYEKREKAPEWFGPLVGGSIFILAGIIELRFLGDP